MSGFHTVESLLQDRMPEAEVALRFAFHLLDLSGSHGVADAHGAIDGAQIRVHANFSPSR